MPVAPFRSEGSQARLSRHDIPANACAIDVRRNYFVVDQFQPVDCRSTLFLGFPTAMPFTSCSVLQVSLNSPCRCLIDLQLSVENLANAIGAHLSAMRCGEHALIV